ncbi:discoidin domain-containing protein [Mycolicibacterium mageritense]|uniref:discoidin domain-containing protein n=1 Tax=Mycolicibacterium mageritense TaxID=53462 RepID=UPI001E6587EF|nr:discoidin domain-containing protein [Mycolicibacterium mageritense]MCC9185569.1 discoidin domain-containing protein [Mycolicibacterium mageritense]
MSDFPAVDGGVPTTDVFVARRKQILATIAPVDAGVAEPAPPAMPVHEDPPAEPTEHKHDPLDDDGYPAEASSAGFLQFPSGDDLDDDPTDDGLDDDDDDDAPRPTQPTTARRRLPRRLRDIDWKSPKVLISALAAVVLVAVLVIAFKPSPAPAPPLTISSAPPPTAAGPPPAPVDVPIKIESATSKCPAGSSEEANAFDGQTDTAWTCKMPYGPGQILTINLGDVYVISKVSLVPGFNKISTSGDEWNKYQTVTKVRWLFGEYSPAKPCALDNNCLEQSTDNTRDVVSVPVVPSKKVSTIKLVILKTTPPAVGVRDSGGSQRCD